MSVGKKAERFYGDNFIWVLSGVPLPNSERPFEYYVIPSSVVSKNVSESHQQWLHGEGKNGRQRKDSDMRTIHLPPHNSPNGWNIEQYRNRWDIIEELLK